MEASTAGAVMTGPQFRERVLRPDGTINRQEFNDLWPALRVMGRCSPQDKYTIVRGEYLAMPEAASVNCKELRIS